MAMFNFSTQVSLPFPAPPLLLPADQLCLLHPDRHCRRGQNAACASVRLPDGAVCRIPRPTSAGSHGGSGGKGGAWTGQPGGLEWVLKYCYSHFNFSVLTGILLLQFIPHVFLDEHTF